MAVNIRGWLEKRADFGVTVGGALSGHLVTTGIPSAVASAANALAQGLALGESESQLMTPDALYAIGWSLATDGEFAGIIRNSAIEQVVNFELLDSNRIRYTNAGGGESTADALVIRWRVDPQTKRGIAPVPSGSDIYRAAQGLDRAFREEARGLVGSLVQVPGIALQRKKDEDAIGSYKLASLEGRTGFVSAIGGRSSSRTASGTVSSADAYKQVKWFPHLPTDAQSARAQLEREVWHCMGVPSGLFAPTMPAREYTRLFCSFVLEPIAARIAAAGAAIGIDAQLRFNKLLRADRAGYARAWATLVAAGYPEDDASELLGIDI